MKNLMMVYHQDGVMYFGKNATNSCAGVDSLTLSDLVQMKIIVV